MTAPQLETTPTDFGPPTADTLVIAEVFGPTVQGEGPMAGRVSGFIRLGGCNLTCSWCDTAYTWDASRFDLREEMRRVSVQSVVKVVQRMDVPRVILTGGEPLLQQKYPAFADLLERLTHLGIAINVETNGTVAPYASMDRVELYVVSPKLANSGIPYDRRVRPDVLRAMTTSDKAVFKFVCRNAADVDEAAAFVIAHQLPREKTWIMPEGVAGAKVVKTLRRIADRAIAHRFNITPRLHTIIWNDERKR